MILEHFLDPKSVTKPGKNVDKNKDQEMRRMKTMHFLRSLRDNERLLQSLRDDGRLLQPPPRPADDHQRCGDGQARQEGVQGRYGLAFGLRTRGYFDSTMYNEPYFALS